MPAWSYNRVALAGQHLFQLGDVKSHPSELVSRVHDHPERVIVTVHGRPSAVLIAPEDLERLEETLEIMRDAATMNRLATGWPSRTRSWLAASSSPPRNLPRP
jgi:prevent-host-death family protein